MRAIRTCLMLLCSACICAPALADGPATAGRATFGRATFGHLGYMLTDLDPDDGIAPALTFTPHPWDPYPATIAMQYSEETALWSGRVPVSDYRRRADDAGGTLDIAYRWEGSSSRTTLSGRNAPSSQLLEVETYLPAGSMYRRFAQSIEADQIAFVLSPKTAVTFFVTLDAAGSSSRDEYNTFTVHGLFDAYFDGAWTQPEGVDLYLSTNLYDPVQSKVQDGFISYAHQSPWETRGYLDLSLEVDAMSVAPVPELSQGTMLAGGLALLAGAGVWRRRRSA